MPKLIRQLELLFENHKEQWFWKADLTRREFKNKDGVRYSTENVGRRLRDLEEARIICVSYEGINAKYRYIPKAWRARYVPIAERQAYSDARWLPAKDARQLAIQI